MCFVCLWKDMGVGVGCLWAEMLKCQIVLEDMRWNKTDCVLYASLCEHRKGGICLVLCRPLGSRWLEISQHASAVCILFLPPHVKSNRGSPILITLCRKSTFYVGWADDCTSLTETHIHASCEFRKFIPCRLFMTNQTCSLFKTSGMEHINRWCKTRTRLECAGQSAPVVIQS